MKGFQHPLLVRDAQSRTQLERKHIESFALRALSLLLFINTIVISSFCCCPSMHTSQMPAFCSQGRFFIVDMNQTANSGWSAKGLHCHSLVMSKHYSQKGTAWGSTSYNIIGWICWVYFPTDEVTSFLRNIYDMILPRVLPPKLFPQYVCSKCCRLNILVQVSFQKKWTQSLKCRRVASNVNKLWHNIFAPNQYLLLARKCWKTGICCFFFFILHKHTE